MNKNVYDEIARVAYDLYEKRGHTHGSDFTDWLEAESMVMKKHAREIESDVKALKSVQHMKTPEKTKTRSARFH